MAPIDRTVRLATPLGSAIWDETLVAVGVVAVGRGAAGVRFGRERSSPGDPAEHVRDGLVHPDHLAATRAPRSCVEGFPSRGFHSTSQGPSSGPTNHRLRAAQSRGELRTVRPDVCVCAGRGATHSVFSTDPDAPSDHSVPRIFAPATTASGRRLGCRTRGRSTER